ncbi:CubicO group peptidase (beta-lactamase class C family) [Rubricella aquisinus]|uniref:CubicO group peptidase (Beta-lactamase class C family) n=1 Tax=Rubricella aquisinus TaxID=2028108 RepID=A0A840WQ38_9RHOB|nr:serine hydrolase domain-containing protein [Rubricella aquisinus]MBB5517158.1 CubicO group peptidase (beta-lactamase class C family) [Rubricella aquisinus]
MTSIAPSLQRLLEKEQAQSNAHALLLRVESGDAGLTFDGSAGDAKPGVRFPIASISKTFTAALTLKLADLGQLDLDQTVQSALPHHDLSDLHVIKGVAHGPTLTIRHLLFQTSGLADYFKGGVEADMLQNKDRAIDLAMVMEMARSLPPMAAPGSGKAHYSDTNFRLLGAVLETVSGKPYATLLQDYVCEPLGLRQTATFDAMNPPLPLFHRSQQLTLPKSLASMDPDGGLVSTPAELIGFLRGFLGGRLFDPALLDDVRNWKPVFFPLAYGGGLMRFHLPRWMTLWRPTPELIGHLGSSGSFAFYAPERDIYLAGTFNQTDLPRRPVGFMLKVLRQLEKAGMA